MRRLLKGWPGNIRDLDYTNKKDNIGMLSFLFSRGGQVNMQKQVFGDFYLKEMQAKWS